MLRAYHTGVRADLSDTIPELDGAGIRPILRGSPLPLASIEPPDRRSGRGSRRAIDRATADQCQSLALAALDKLDRAILLLDLQHEVVFANRSARATLQHSRCIAVRNRRLAFTDVRATAAFEKWRELGTGHFYSRLEPPVLSGRAQLVEINRIEQNQVPVGYRVLVFVPWNEPRLLPISAVQELYGFTFAEGRLVNSLYSGLSLKEAARAIGVSSNTAKSQLKRIFEKCEVKSQASLLQLLTQGPRSL